MLLLTHPSLRCVQKREYPAFAAEFRALLSSSEARASAAKAPRAAPTFDEARRQQAADKAAATAPSPSLAVTPRPPPASEAEAAAEGTTAFDVSKLSLRKKGASPALQTPSKGKTPEDAKKPVKARRTAQAKPADASRRSWPCKRLA